jgi:antitoxin (DNA-binding transcriptional repressor) of toxin-antitoxin stability system
MDPKTSRVGVRELRKHFNAYLDRVKRGETLLVMERNQVVASLAPKPAMNLMERLVVDGRATAATRSIADLIARPRLRVRVRQPLSRILEEMREESD